jgi:hypothetical protein
VVRPWAHGTFTRPQKVAGLPSQGDIWVCKLGWWSGAPWDILAYARGHPTYPCDSTLEQLYNSDEFRAYHQLGVVTVLDAAKRCRPPLMWAPESVSEGGTAQPDEIPAAIDPAGDLEVEDRIAARVREALLGEPLDAFDGFLVVELFNLSGDRVTRGRSHEIRRGQAYRVVAYLAHSEPTSAAVVEPVAIKGPRRPAAVSFSVSALSDVTTVSPRLVQIRAPVNADSEHAEFSFVAPEKSTPLALWVQLQQRDALIQVARLELHSGEA